MDKRRVHAYNARPEHDSCQDFGTAAVAKDGAMDVDSIPIKTAKGVEEMETRKHGLPPRLRTALIMVDGHSTLAEILAKCGEFAERIESHLRELQAQAYIETGEAAEAEPEPAEPTAAADMRPGGGIKSY